MDVATHATLANLIGNKCDIGWDLTLTCFAWLS